RKARRARTASEDEAGDLPPGRRPLRRRPATAGVSQEQVRHKRRNGLLRRVRKHGGSWRNPPVLNPGALPNSSVAAQIRAASSTPPASTWISRTSDETATHQTRE